MRKYFFRFHQVYYLIQSFLHFSNFFLFQKFWRAKYFELQLVYCYSNQIQIFLSLNENFKMKVLKLFLYLILSPTYQNYSRLIFKKIAQARASTGELQHLSPPTFSSIVNVLSCAVSLVLRLRALIQGARAKMAQCFELQYLRHNN